MDLSCNNWEPELVVTELRKNPYYARFYNTLVRLFFLGILPFALLAYFNYNIYNGMRLPPVLLQLSSLHHAISRTPSDARRIQENEAARILLGIIAVFLICHALRVTCDIYDMIYFENIIGCYLVGKKGVHAWVLYGYEFSNALITLNSSLNMIIYGLIKPNIRKHYFGCMKKENNREHQLNASKVYFPMRNVLSPRRNCVPSRNTVR